MCLVVIIQSVSSEKLNHRLVFHLLFRYIREINAGSIALVFHVESELVLFHRRCEIIHVLHHQVPVALVRVVAGILQRLYEQCLLHILLVGCELTHLISLSAGSIFVCYGKHLVGLQRRLQRDISESLVHGIFRRIEQTCALQLLVVGTSHEPGNPVEHGTRLVDVPRRSIRVDHLGVFAVGIVRRHG